MRKTATKWSFLWKAKTWNTHLIGRTHSRWQVSSHIRRKRMEVAIIMETNFQKALHARAVITWTCSRCRLVVNMANRVICRTANVWEKAIPSLSHHLCWVLDKTTLTRIIQVATHQRSDNLWRETWRIRNISSRLIRVIQPQPIRILAKEDPLQCLIRQIWIDLPSRRITSTTREICSEECNSMEWDHQ